MVDVEKLNMQISKFSPNNFNHMDFPRGLGTLSGPRGLWSKQKVSMKEKVRSESTTFVSMLEPRACFNHRTRKHESVDLVASESSSLRLITFKTKSSIPTSTIHSGLQVSMETQTTTDQKNPPFLIPLMERREPE